MAKAAFPLNLAQQDICLDELHRRGKPLYNVGGYIRMGRIDPVRMADAHAELVAQQEIFGVRIVSDASGLAQSFSTERTLSLPTRDFSGNGRAHVRARRWLDDYFQQPFSMEGAELFRACLLKISPQEYWYVGLAHHCVMDGWGFSNWAIELSRLYGCRNEPQAPTGHWRQIALNDQDYLRSERYREDRRFWQECLQRVPGKLLRPRDPTERLDGHGGVSRRRVRTLSRETLNSLNALAETTGVGLTHVFLGMLVCYFAATAGCTSFLFGVPYHNRGKALHKRMLGVFTGIHPLLIQLASDCRVVDMLRLIAKQQRTALRHQRYPIGHITRDLGMTDGSRPLYDVGFNYLRLDGELEFDGSPANLVYLSHHHELTPLMVTIWEHGNQGAVELQLDCRHEYFSDDDMTLLEERLVALLERLPAQAQDRIDAIEVLGPGERQFLLSDHRENLRADSAPRLAHQFFEQQVLRAADATAVRDGRGSLTYGELNRRAGQIARTLRDGGVRRGTLVGICMRRSAEMVAAVLGVLKAGGAYVSFDVDYGFEHLAAAADYGGVQVILTEQVLAHRVRGSGALLITIEQVFATDEAAGNVDADALTPDSLAMVRYRRTSSGELVGVERTHQGIATLIEWIGQAYSSAELGVVLAAAPLAAEMSLLELFAPLSWGHECIVVEDTLADLPSNITLLSTTPSRMRTLLDRNAVPAAVLAVNLTGEALPMELANELLWSGLCDRVFNLYAAEGAGFATCAIFSDVLTERPTIGNPIPGVRARVLTAAGKLAPVGVTGELHIAGVGRGCGAVAALQRCWVPDHLHGSDGDVLLRTGDLARCRHDGTLELVGRAHGATDPGAPKNVLRYLQEQLGAVHILSDGFL